MALGGGEGSGSRPGRSLPPGKTRYPLYRRPSGPQGRSGQVRKISPPTGIRSRVVHPVVSRYSDYPTRPTYVTRMTLKQTNWFLLHFICREFYESVDLFNFLWDRTVLTATLHDEPYALLCSSLANLAQYLWDRKMFQWEVQYSVCCTISNVPGCSICWNLLYNEYPVSFTFAYRKWSLPKF